MFIEAALFATSQVDEQPPAQRQQSTKPLQTDDRVQTPHSNIPNGASATAVVDCNSDGDEKTSTSSTMTIDKEKKIQKRWFKMHVNVAVQFIVDSWNETMNAKTTPIEIAEAMKVGTLTAKSVTIIDQAHADDFAHFQLVLSGFGCLWNCRDQVETDRLYIHPRRREIIMKIQTDGPLSKLARTLLYTVDESRLEAAKGRHQEPYISVATYERPDQLEAFLVMKKFVDTDPFPKYPLGYHVNPSVSTELVECANINNVPF